MEGLLLGIDLGNYYSQVSVYNEKKGEIEGLSPYPSVDEGLIPTVLGVTADKRSWLYGRECDGREAVRIENILESISRNENFTIYETEFLPESILEKFLKKLLLLVRTRYPLHTVAKLCIAVEKKNEYLEHTVYGALEKLGIGKDRAFLQSYEEAYIGYVLAQKKELWLNDTGLFDFNEKGLFYRQISLNRENVPMAVYVLKKDYSEALRYEWLKSETEREKLSYIFLKLAKEALYKQNVSTLYITGAGFLEPFAKQAFQELCVGRRVFVGQNLYTRGACYQAMAAAGKRKTENYVFMGEDIIDRNICLPVYRCAREEAVCLCQFGTPWQKASGQAEVILDEEEEIRIVVNDPLKKEDKVRIIPLDGLPMRPKRMTRLCIAVEFLSEKEFVVTVKDMGFGSFYKTSSRIWEKRMKL